MESNYL